MATEQAGGAEPSKERPAELQPIVESREQALLAVEHIVRVEEKISENQTKIALRKLDNEAAKDAMKFRVFLITLISGLGFAALLIFLAEDKDRIIESVVKYLLGFGGGIGAGLGLRGLFGSRRQRKVEDKE